MRPYILATLAIVSMTLGGTVYAADDAAPEAVAENAAPTIAAKEHVKSAQSAPAAQHIDLKAMQKMRELIAEKKKTLNGSRWEVNLGTNDPKAPKGGAKDSLIFQNGQLTSDTFSKRGFGPSNYTITVPSEGSETAVFETMQTNSKEEAIFIRGEWNKDSMQGNITEQYDKGKSRDWWFSSASRQAISPTSAEEGKTAPSVEESPAAAKALTSEKPAAATKSLVSSERKKR